MSLDRSLQPDFKNIDHINIPALEKRTLDNGIEIFIINAGTQDILKIDVLIDVSNWDNSNPLIASTVNKMLIEGTSKLTSQQIAEHLDFYGSFIQMSPTKDFGNITLFTLKKYLAQTIHVLDEIIKEPVFPDHELTTYISNNKQKFIIESEKVTELARREFNQQLFGQNHPYGKKIQVEHYDHITRDELISFHKDFYNPVNCKIILSGKIDEQDINLFNKYLGNTNWATKTQDVLTYKNPAPLKMESFIEKDDVTQSAIRLGKITINKSHPDYHKLNIVSTILGGYFGSRLMKTIREEKGYTYGINSFIVSLKNAGFFIILSEVGSNVTRDAISDILLEIKKLREELVTDDELMLVKNYMLGELLRSFDGPIEISSSYKSIIELGLNPDYFEQKFNAIKSITPEMIKHIANEYLHEDTLIKTIAGKYN